MEDDAIKHVIALCKDTKVPCHIVHLATGNAIRKIIYSFLVFNLKAYKKSVSVSKN